MIYSSNVKYVSITPPAAIVDNAAYTTAEVDTLGYDYATIVVYLGATDIAMAVLKVQDGDVSGTTADVTGLVFGTSTDPFGTTSVLPTATDDNKFFVFEIDLRARKRYLDLQMTAGDGAAGTFAAAFAILSRGDILPNSLTDHGVGGMLRL